MSFFDTDPTKPTPELLSDIRSAANHHGQPGLPLIPFATLLVRLSQEASVTADKNIQIQRRMIIITLIVLAISVAQLVLALLQFKASSPNDPQRIVATPQPVQTESNQKNVVTNKKPIEPVHVAPNAK